MRLEEASRDHYRRLSRKEGYRSRSSYKLLQIDRKYRILRPGSVVVDFGCAPGGWLQVASKSVGPSGFVMGIDIRTVKPPAENVRTLMADVNDPGIEGIILKALPRKADVALSDISPNISGLWDLDHRRQIDLTLRILSLLPPLLAKGGGAVLKVFEGEELGNLIRSLERSFHDVKLVKPEASLQRSSELYLLCTKFTGAARAPSWH